MKIALFLISLMALSAASASEKCAEALRKANPPGFPVYSLLKGQSLAAINSALNISNDEKQRLVALINSGLEGYILPDEDELGAYYSILEGSSCKVQWSGYLQVRK